MSLIPYVSDWSSSLVDGWNSYANNTTEYYDFIHRLNGGFWSTYEYFEVSGFVEAEGLISGNIELYRLLDITGDTQGVGYIFSDVYYKEPLIISGECIGIGSCYSRFNFSRQRALYPELRRELTYEWASAPIAAVEYIDFSPNKVLNVTTKEDSVFENTTDFYIIETLYNSNNKFPITHYPFIDNCSGKIDYLVTDLKAEGQNGKQLFYQYEFLFDMYSTEDGESITLYKNNEIKIDKSQYVVRYSYDLLSDGSTRYDSSIWRSQDPTKSVHRVKILLPLEYGSKEDFFTVDYNKSIYGARTPQKELVELTSIYEQEVDYGIGESGLFVLNGQIPADAQTLYIVKDPYGRIKPLGINPPVYQPDEVSSWRLRLNTGSMLTKSGIYNGETEKFFLLENHYVTTKFPITNVKPIYISENIVKVGQYPIYLNELKYKFPLYQVDLYDKSSLTMVTDLGNVSIEVNGRARTDLKILSVDRDKGYFQLNTSLDSTDEIEFNFYVESSKHLVVENLELNPKVVDGDTLYHMSGFYSGLGVALKEYNPDDIHTYYPYIYNSELPESSRIYYEVPPIGTLSGYQYLYDSSNFFPICDININRLSTDIVKVTDARRIGGGLKMDSDLDKWFAKNSEVSIREKDSYLGNAFYGGDPQSFGSTVIIHVPSGVLIDARERWIASLAGYVSDPVEQKDRGTKEFNYYLDKVIKKYISAGTSYILIPIDSDGNFMNIANLTYDNTI